MFLVQKGLRQLVITSNLITSVSFFVVGIILCRYCGQLAIKLRRRPRLHSSLQVSKKYIYMTQNAKHKKGQKNSLDEYTHLISDANI